nr:hypothetical protein [Anaerolineae bacterium]
VNSKAYIWDVPNAAIILTLPTSGAAIDSLDWTTQNNDKIVGASYDGPGPNLRVWDATTGQITFSKGMGQLATASWNSNGTLLLVGDGLEINTVNPANGQKQLLSANSIEVSAVTNVAWSPDGTKVANSGVCGQVTFYNASTGQFIAYSDPSRSAVNWISWSNDSTRLASASWDGTVRIWNADDGKLLNTIEPNAGRIFAVNWSPDDQNIVFGAEDGTAKIVPALSVTSTPTSIPEPVNPPPPASTTVRAVAWNPDGLWIARAFQNGTVDVINADTGAIVFTFNNGQSPATALAWRPGTGSTKLAAAVNSKAYIWDVPNAAIILTLPTSGAVIYSLDWTTQNGDKIVGATYDGPAPNLRVWDASTGQLAFSKGLVDLATASWNPNGTKLAIGSGLGIETVDTGTGQDQLLSANSYELSPVTSVAWSPDGSKIANSGVLGQVTFYNASTGQFIAYSEPSRSFVRWIAWSNDSTKLASASWDGTIRIWNAVDGSLLNTIELNVGRIFAVDWSPDDSHIVFGAEDGTVQIISPFTVIVTPTATASPTP